MGLRIALTSTGPLSGKTTLSRYLETEFGFYRADHSRSIVESFVDYWNLSSGFPTTSAERLTVSEVYANKELWRPMLQDYSYRAGFADPAGGAIRWTRHTLGEWLVNREKSVVFEPARGDVQAGVLRGMGFTIVQLEISDTVRCIRAGLLGLNCKDILSAMKAQPELELGVSNPDVVFDGSLPVNELAEVVLHIRES